MAFDPAAPENAIYARPPEYWKVFVSSKMAGGALRAERAAAVEAIDAFPLTRAWVWERDAVAGPYCSEPECVRQAGTSDLLVLVLGDELTSVTRREFEAARAASVPTFVFLQAGVERDGDAEMFVARIREDGLTQAFLSPGELATQITRAIRTWALREGRSSVLRARERNAPAPSLVEDDVDFRNVEVTSTNSSSSTSIGDLLTDAERLVGERRTGEALEHLWEVAQLAWDAGLAWITLPVLAELDRIIPPDTIDDRWRGWIENTRGLALGTQGRNEEAVEAFQRMRQLGKSLGDADLEGTALQNLGVQDVLARRHASARRRFEQSVRLKQSIGDWRGSIQVLLNSATLLIEQGNLDAAGELLDDVELLLSRIRDPLLRNTLHGQRGMLAVARRDFVAARAHFREALLAARRADSGQRQVTTMLNLGSVAADLELPAESRRWYAKALELAERLRDTSRIQQTRQALALALLRCGQPAEAAAAFERAGDEALALGDPARAAIAFGDAGAAWLDEGNASNAVALINKALQTTSGADEWRVTQLCNLALALERTGEPEQGLARLREAANLAGDWAETAATLRQAGEFALAHPALAHQASTLFVQELELRRAHELGERWGWRAAEIGASLNHTSQVGHSPTFFTAALRVFASRKDYRQAFFIRNDRAIAFAEIDDLRAATKDLQTCLRLAERLEDRALLQQAHANLSEIQRRRGANGLARSHAATSLRLAREMRDLRSEAEAEAHLGLIAIDAGEELAALEHFENAERVGTELRDPEIRGMAFKGRAAVAVRRGAERQAAQLYRRAARLLSGVDAPQQLSESLSGVMLSEASVGRWSPELAEDLYGLARRLGSESECLSTLTTVFARLEQTSASEQTLIDAGAVTLLLAIHCGTQDKSDESRVESLSLAVAVIADWTCPGSERSTRVKAISGAVERKGGAEIAAAVTDLLVDARAAFVEARSLLPDAS